MPISIDEFWRLAAVSGLLAPANLQALQTEFSRLKGAGQQANAASLAEWLIASGALSRYQASVLLAGRPGPFVFGDFTIVERIESGRLARTFRAVFRGSQRALLLFASSDGEGIDWGDGGIDRAEAAKAVKSPHVSRVHQFIKSASPPFFVLEDLQGQSLRERLSAAPLGRHDACRIGFQAALGLLAIHERCDAHGNLCPENLWVEPSSTVKLLQFPLAVTPRAHERLRAPALDYLAPELQDPRCGANKLTDIYSLGCLIFELIAGHVPFPGGTVQERLARHRGEVPERLDRLVPGVKEELADLVYEMLEKEPVLRPQTVSHVAHLLAPLASGDGRGQRVTPPRTEGQRLAPGYGAWTAPSWQAPPKQVESSRASKQQSAAPTPSAAPVEKPVARPIAKPSAAAAATPPNQVDPTASTVKRPQSASSTAERRPDVDAPVIIVGAQAGEPSVTTMAGAALIKRRRANTTAMGVAAGLFVIVLIVALGFLLSGGGSERGGAKPADPSATAPDTQPTTAPAPLDDTKAQAPPDAAAAGEATTTSNNEQQVDDDGQTLWASPTSGKAWDLHYVPSGAQLLLVLRPADILASAEGARLVQALGPSGEAAMQKLQDSLGVELASVKRLTVALVPDEAGAPQIAYVAELAQAMAEATLVEKWGKPRAATRGAKTFHQGDRLAYYVPPAGQGQIVVVAPPAVMQEIIDRDGAATMGRGMEKLLSDTDSDRHISLLAASGYLLAEGNGLWVGELARLREPLARLLAGNLQAVLASAHLGNELFLELRALGPVDSRPQELAALLASRLQQSGEQLERYVASLNPWPYGRLVVHRFPRMMQLANGFTRLAAVDGQAVLRCYLPENAAHNLVLGAELTLLEQPGATSPAQNPTPAPASRSAADALAESVSLTVPRDSLERVLELLAAEMGLPIAILGADLQLEGITKNQQLGIDEHDQPAAEVLGKVLALANPDGKLVYVIKPGEDGRETIFVTTRAAAKKRGDALPGAQEKQAPPGRKVDRG